MAILLQLSGPGVADPVGSHARMRVCAGEDTSVDGAEHELDKDHYQHLYQGDYNVRPRFAVLCACHPIPSHP